MIEKNVRRHHRMAEYFKLLPLKKTARGSQMSNKLYVGNMSYATTEESLTELFSQFGTVVSANIIKDRFTDQSKGFGFVEMDSPNSATAAIEALNGREFNGRNLRVNIAENKPRDNNNRERRNNYRY